ncbi:hypothetical protein ILYODFUR_027261 [Ilyodon furcidens]|uniref:Pyrin domain-containing protein n=1 Tax=Ilyodon furcidens TaxID=33524 RepID=A0ABV0TMF2_9TELE
MSRRSIKLLLADTLEDLSNQNFEKFYYHLLDRRQEPRVGRSKVEGKTRLEIVDVLVSTFTEEGAVGVTEEILREIGCNSEAETLVLNEREAGNTLDQPQPRRCEEDDKQLIFLSCWTGAETEDIQITSNWTSKI